MWMAHHFPDTPALIDRLWHMTPEQTKVLNQVGLDLLDEDEQARWKHTKTLAEASGARVM